MDRKEQAGVETGIKFIEASMQMEVILFRDTNEGKARLITIAFEHIWLSVKEILLSMIPHVSKFLTLCPSSSKQLQSKDSANIVSISHYIVSVQ